MGYCYGTGATGRAKLVCEHCGTIGGVRKRTCPHKVVYPTGGSLPYCPAPALCGPCLKREYGGLTALHADCAAPAAKRTQEEHQDYAKLLAGDAKVSGRWGDWCATVPAGQVGSYYATANGQEIAVLTSEPNTPRWLSDVNPEDVGTWTGPHA